MELNLNQLLAGVISGSGPTGIIVGVVAVVVYQWAKTKFPILKSLPNLVKLPGEPTPAPAPIPETSPAVPETGRPMLDALIRILGPRAEVVLAQEVYRSLAPPEPTSPVR